MRRRSPFLVAGLAVLAAGLASVLGACGSFRASADDVSPDAGVGTEDASDAHLAEAEPEADAAALDAAAPNDGGADALTPCDASFCDDFESGDLAAAAARWGAIESTKLTTGVVISAGAPARRFFHVSTAATADSYVRLTHPIGPITSATTIDLRFQLRITSSSNSEIIAFNLINGGGTISADLTIRASMDGTLMISWSNGGGYTSSPATMPVGDGLWHAVIFQAAVGGATLQVDTQAAVPVSGSPLATFPQCHFSAGAYLLAGGAPATADLDDVRLVVQ